MTNAFTAADAKSSAAVSRLFGTDLRLHPRKRTTDFGAGGFDPDRPKVRFRGVLSGAVDENNVAGDRGSNFTGRVTSKTMVCSADASVWPASARAGDWIEDLALPGVFYAINAANFDGVNRWIVPLVRVRE